MKVEKYSIRIIALLSALLIIVATMPIVSVYSLAKDNIPIEDVAFFADFEGGTTGFTQPEYMTVQQDFVHSGNYAAKVQGKNNYCSKNLKVEKNTDYVLEFYCARVLHRLWVQIKTSNWSANIKQSSCSPNSGDLTTYDWQKRTFTFNSGDNENIVLVFFQEVNEYSFIDDICLYKKPEGETQIVTNGDFEDGTTGFSGNKITITSDAEYVHAGNYSAKIEGSWAWCSRNFEVEKNKDYVIQFYAKNNQNRLLYQIKDGSWNNIVQSYAKSGTGWVKQTLAFNSRNNAGIGLAMAVDGNYTCYIDDISIAPKINVSTVAEEGGTASSDAEKGYIAKGDEIVFTAIPDIGFSFEGWYKGTEKVSDQPIYKYKAESDIVLTAKFFEKTQNLNFESSDKWDVKCGDWGYSGKTEIGEISSLFAHTGDKSLLIHKAGGKIAKTDEMYFELATTPDTDYILQFYTKTKNGKSGVIASVIAQKGTTKPEEILVKDFTVISKTDWSQNRVSFNSNEFEKVYLKLCPGEDDTYIDNIYLGKALEFNYFGLGDFETGDLAVLGKDSTEYFKVALNDGENNLSHSGIYSFEMCGGGFKNTSITINLKENTDYQFSCYARGGTGGAGLVKLENYKDYSMQKYLVTSDMNDEWEYKTFDFNSGNNKMLYLLFVSDGNGRSCFIDDICLTEKIKVVANAENGGTATLSEELPLKGHYVTFKAHSDIDCVFEGWYNGTEKVSEDRNYSIMAMEELTLTAKFIPTAENLDFENGNINNYSNVNNNYFKVISKDENSAFVNNGSYALEIVGKSKEDRYISVPIKLQKNTDYCLGCYSKQGSGGSVLLELSNGTETITKLNIMPDTDWKDDKILFNSDDYSDAILKIYAYGDGNCYLDDISIYKYVDSTSFKKLVNDAKLMNGGDFTKSSWPLFEVARKRAEDLLNTPKQMDKEAIEEATVDLNTAWGLLEYYCRTMYLNLNDYYTNIPDQKAVFATNKSSTTYDEYVKDLKFYNGVETAVNILNFAPSNGVLSYGTKQLPDLNGYEFLEFYFKCDKDFEFDGNIGQFEIQLMSKSGSAYATTYVNFNKSYASDEWQHIELPLSSFSTYSKGSDNLGKIYELIDYEMSRFRIRMVKGTGTISMSSVVAIDVKQATSGVVPTIPKMQIITPVIKVPDPVKNPFTGVDRGDPWGDLERLRANGISPQTGDNMPKIAFYLMFLSAIAIIFMLGYEFKMRSYKSKRMKLKTNDIGGRQL